MHLMLDEAGAEVGSRLHRLQPRPFRAAQTIGTQRCRQYLAVLLMPTDRGFEAGARAPRCSCCGTAQRSRPSNARLARRAPGAPAGERSVHRDGRGPGRPPAARRAATLAFGAARCATASSTSRANQLAGAARTASAAVRRVAPVRGPRAAARRRSSRCSPSSKRAAPSSRSIPPTPRHASPMMLRRQRAHGRLLTQSGLRGEAPRHDRCRAIISSTTPRPAGARARGSHARPTPAPRPALAYVDLYVRVDRRSQGRSRSRRQRAISPAAQIAHFEVRHPRDRPRAAVRRAELRSERRADLQRSWR